MFIVYFSYFNISHDTIFSLPPSIYTKLLESQALCFIETIFVCPFMNSNQTPFNSATDKTLIKKKKKKMNKLLSNEEVFLHKTIEQTKLLVQCLHNQIL